MKTSVIIAKLHQLERALTQYSSNNMADSFQPGSEGPYRRGKAHGYEGSADLVHELIEEVLKDTDLKGDSR